MNVKLKSEKIITLGENEVLEENQKCPECGGQLITNYGPGISCTFCTNEECNYNDYDYDF
jgi:ssDNA-binding Zn-finger/Zn-ribbon topoisomerase 1